MIRLAIVVPCYNEEAVLPETVRRLGALLGQLAAAGKVGPDSGAWLVISVMINSSHRGPGGPAIRHAPLSLAPDILTVRIQTWLPD